MKNMHPAILERWGRAYRCPSPNGRVLTLVPSMGKAVNGFVVRNLVPSDLMKIQDFEGGGYSSRVIRVRTGRGLLYCFVFLANKETLEGNVDQTYAAQLNSISNVYGCTFFSAFRNSFV